MIFSHAPTLLGGELTAGSEPGEWPYSTPAVYFAYADMSVYDADFFIVFYSKASSDADYGGTLDLAVTNGFAYVASSDEKLRRFDANGDLLWTYTFTSQIDSILKQLITDPDGNAYLRQSGDLLKISDQGALVWTYNGGVGVGPVTANGDGETWMAQGDGASTYTLDRVDASGSQVWRATLPGSPEQVALDSELNSYVVGSGSNYIRSFDADGNQRWSVGSFGSSTIKSAAVSKDDAFLFTGDAGDRLRKIDTTDGSVLATYTDPDGDVVATVGGDGFIYAIILVPGGDPAIGRKIDPSDLSVVQSVTLTDHAGASPMVAADPGLHPSFYAGVAVSGRGPTWSQIGNSLSVPNIDDVITALNSTDVALRISDGQSINELRTYQFDGADWSQVGNALGISISAIAALDSTDVALIDQAGNPDELKVYRWDGADWAQVGNSLGITGTTILSPTLAALNSTDVAFYDRGNKELRLYRWDGTDWSQIGNSLSIASDTGDPALAALNSTDVAYFDTHNDELRTYRFDGTDWAQVGNSLGFNSANFVSMVGLSNTDVAYFDSLNEEFRTYRWDGSTWVQLGSDLSVSTTAGVGLAALSSTKIAAADSGANTLTTYGFS